MKFSIVTISFNQAEFLEQTIQSVLDQRLKDLEYIIVDPGSTDGSREIIERYRPHFARVILEPDKGAADGLNKGFACATGQLFGFLNSDDVLFPGALTAATDYLRANPQLDVVSGDCQIIDAEGRYLRKCYSDRFSLVHYAYGSSILIQPSTFFRAEAYRRTRGFNVENRSNWDGELFVDMARTGARFGRTRQVWSRYRVHERSITGTGRLDARIAAYRERMFRDIMGRAPHRADPIRAAAVRGPPDDEPT